MKLRVKMTASPISRMLPGSLAEGQDAYQRPGLDEPGRGISTPYSITWSARNNTDCGIVNRSALTVFALEDLPPARSERHGSARCHWGRTPAEDVKRGAA